ncbi:MAG TPA: bifunctional helix-turn-helix transcriptional regulator/GNAT family N-acetyltransferase [Roseiflexaceae bacterium]
MAESSLHRHVDDVRHFNRFYTRQIGLLQQGYLNSPFSLTEVRVLYELAHHDATTATVLCRELDLDPGYLSRILRGFLKRGLIDRQASRDDGRQSVVRLTPRGQDVFAPLNTGAAVQIGALLERLSDAQRSRLVDAMQTIQGLLDQRAQREPVAYVLRPPRAGDMGWVVQRHGVLYAQEYGYDEHFEALVATIVAKFVAHFDARRERCWIAERDGEPVGCIFLVKSSKRIGKLRLFLVEPTVRGVGIGARLIEECVRFARSAGYRRIRLWTQSELLAARRLYARAGFRLIAEEPHHSWSKDLVSETWELKL